MKLPVSTLTAPTAKRMAPSAAMTVTTRHFRDAVAVSHGCRENFGRWTESTPAELLRKEHSIIRKEDILRLPSIARGALPRDIQDVMARHKDIMYSSRTRYNTDVYRRVHRLKTRLYEALTKVPEDRLSDEERKIRDELEKMPEITILHIIYQQKAYEGHAKDYEFSGTSMREHWLSGYEDTKRTLKRPDWLAIPPRDVGVLVHDVHREDE
jgi:hypothetical protein